jgi:hypothetical protein
VTETEQAIIKRVENSIKEIEKVQELEGVNGHQLGDSARKILDQTKGDVLSVFKNALDRLNDTRRACDAAEQHIKDKRADVERALFEYVQAVEILATRNGQIQEAIGDLMISNDQV